MKKQEQIIIKLERGGEDRLIPKGFFHILVHRFFPVLSLTYISSVLGIAMNKGYFHHYMFEVRTAYEMALFIALWVSFPSIVWIFLKSNPLLTHLADFWYRIIAALMTVTISLSFVLFPEAEIFGLRTYFVLSIPVFVIVYIFFVKEALPKIASYPLNALGFCTLLYGSLIGIVF